MPQCLWLSGYFVEHFLLKLMVVSGIRILIINLDPNPQHSLNFNIIIFNFKLSRLEPSTSLPFVCRELPHPLP